MSIVGFSQIYQTVDDRFLQSHDKLKNGSNAGELLEYKNKRTPLILKANEISDYGLEDNKTYIANFKHAVKNGSKVDSSFYIAEVIGSKVKNLSAKSILASDINNRASVHFVKEKWAGDKRAQIQELEAHSSLLIRFPRPDTLAYPENARGVKLVMKQTDVGILKKIKNPILISDIVISIEAFRTHKEENKGFFPGGLLDHFGVGLRIYSAAENYHRRGKEVSSYHDDYYSLKYVPVKNSMIKNADPAMALLTQAIIDTDIMGRTQNYNLFNYNCTNMLFNLIDQVLDYSKVNKYGSNKIDHDEYYTEIKTAIEKNFNNVINYLSNSIFSDVTARYSDFYHIVKDAVRNKGKEDLLSYIESMDSRERELLSSYPIFIKANLIGRGILSHVNSFSKKTKVPSEEELRN